MRVQCTASTGADLEAPFLTRGYTTSSSFDVEVGEEYFVHGICFYHGLVLYLIDPKDQSMPNWYPAALFRIIDARVSPTWWFSHAGREKDGVSAIFGYRELVLADDHFDALAERDMDALLTFARQKAMSRSLSDTDDLPSASRLADVDEDH